MRGMAAVVAHTGALVRRPAAPAAPRRSTSGASLRGLGGGRGLYRCGGAAMAAASTAASGGLSLEVEVEVPATHRAAVASA